MLCKRITLGTVKSVVKIFRAENRKINYSLKESQKRTLEIKELYYNCKRINETNNISVMFDSFAFFGQLKMQRKSSDKKIIIG